MISHYSQYARHCMRFYSRYPSPQFRSEVDELNWKACEEALKSFSQRDREILVEVYLYRVPIDESVKNVSVKHHISEENIWCLLKTLEGEIAKRRELI